MSSKSQDKTIYTHSKEGVKVSGVATELGQVVNKAVAFLIGEEVH